MGWMYYLSGQVTSPTVNTNCVNSLTFYFKTLDPMDIIILFLSLYLLTRWTLSRGAVRSPWWGWSGREGSTDLRSPTVIWRGFQSWKVIFVSNFDYHFNFSLGVTVVFAKVRDCLLQWSHFSRFIAKIRKIWTYSVENIRKIIQIFSNRLTNILDPLWPYFPSFNKEFRKMLHFS